MAEEKKESPKIHIDSDWKAQAQKEKQRIADQAKAAPAASGGGGGQAAGAQGMPPASFETLIHSLATQALLAMGAVPDPRSGQRYLNLDLARHQIDMLSVIEQKTKNNLTEDESKLLTAALYELRSRYIQAATAARGR